MRIARTVQQPVQFRRPFGDRLRERLGQGRELEHGAVRPARLYVFSDGTYEVGRPDGSMLEFSALAEALAQPVAAGASELDRLLDCARDAHGPGVLEDDFTILRLAL